MPSVIIDLDFLYDKRYYLLEISFPSFMTASSSLASLLPFLTYYLRRSPVDKWINLYFLTRISHCLYKIIYTFLFLSQDHPKQRSFLPWQVGECSKLLVVFLAHYKPTLS